MSKNKRIQLLLQLLHEVFHSRTFQLEDALGLAGGEKLIHFRVIVGYRIDGKCRIFLPGHLLRILDHREGAKPQEIHLEKSELLKGRHGILRRDGAVGRARQRNVLIRRRRCDNHARRMNGGMPREALQFLSKINQPPDLRVGLHKLRQLLVDFQSLGDVHSELHGNHLRNDVHPRIRKVHGTADVADDTAGLQRTEGYNLYHVVLAVVAHYVVDDFLAPLIAEVHVDIGPGLPLGV